MNHNKLEGLIAATYTPLTDQGQLNLDAVGPMADYLLARPIRGLYVCGSTGEGMSLTGEERRAVAEAYVKATAGRVPVIVQVGHNSLAEARELAAHAGRIGADVLSATCPSYFKVECVEGLVACMAEVAAGAPELPFYYYHIPSLTGAKIDMVRFLQLAEKRIPNLVGIKYTETTLHEFQQCRELDGGRWDVLWGCDEMLLGALATGARGAIGSTYNIAAPLYAKLVDAFDRGNLDEAREHQAQSVAMIHAIYQFPFHSAMKEVLKIAGLEVGRCRLPQRALRPEETAKLRDDLEQLGFFQWSGVIT